uniref:CSC1/OSCA1-like 7TM region domain-containing protein n=1 Tax=Fagus sylvatica TaxID=28930 RepID=A0A2N9G9G5_FAGSY
MLLFSWLSSKPGNAVIYYPNRILKGLDPFEGGSRTRNPFSWIREAMSSTEQDVISISGYDTAVYFVFLSTVLGILVLSGLVLLPVLLPVAATDDNGKSAATTSNGTFSDLEKLSMGNVKSKSPRLWAFLLALYWVSFVTYYLLWKAYKHVSGLRADALMSREVVRPEQFAILVRDIPPVPEGQTRKDQVDSYFKTIHPETFYRSMVVTNNKEVNKIWKELEGYKKKLARAEAIYAKSKTTGKPEGARPTNKIGFLGLIGKKVDSIEYYNAKINEVTPKLEVEQKVTRKEKQQNSALVFFTSRVAAAAAAQSLHAHIVDKWTVTDAPEPRQLIWIHSRTIQKKPDSIVSILASSLPLNATFFLTFVALKFFVGYGLQLSRLVPLIIYHLKRKYICKTEAELKEAWFPGDLGYGTRVPGDMLIVTIVLCYSVIAPIIIPFGVVYFGLGWLILRNQALKVHVPAYESYGRMWPHMHTRILASLILYQVTMLGYFGTKIFHYAPFLIPLILLSLTFGYVCSQKFYRFFRDAALEVACRELKEAPNMEQIFRAYIPPSLSSEKIDDEDYEDALSQVSRSGSFV